MINFINLCHHKEDFGINAEFMFFATSIGGTVKRLTAKASLKKTVPVQILNVRQMFDLCTNKIRKHSISHSREIRFK